MRSLPVLLPSCLRHSAPQGLGSKVLGWRQVTRRVGKVATDELDICAQVRTVVRQETLDALNPTNQNCADD